MCLPDQKIVKRNKTTSKSRGNEEYYELENVRVVSQAELVENL